VGMTEGDVEMKKKSNGDNIKERGNDRSGGMTKRSAGMTERVGTI